MLYETPEARGMLYGEYVRLIDLIAEALAHRPDAPEDTTQPERSAAYAAVGHKSG